MSTTTRLMTADEFLVLPRIDGIRLESVRGEVRTRSLPGEEHGDVAMAFGSLLYNHVKANGLGRVYAGGTGFFVERDPDTLDGPDVSFVRTERLALIVDRPNYIPFAPDLAVEVASPSDRPSEIAEKTARWLAAGTRIVWNLDPRTQTAAVHRPGSPPTVLSAEDSLDGAEVVAGFRCRVGDLFE